MMENPRQLVPHLQDFFLEESLSERKIGLTQ